MHYILVIQLKPIKPADGTNHRAPKTQDINNHILSTAIKVCLVVWRLKRLRFLSHLLSRLVNEMFNY